MTERLPPANGPLERSPPKVAEVPANLDFLASKDPAYVMQMMLRCRASQETSVETAGEDIDSMESHLLFAISSEIRKLAITEPRLGAQYVELALTNPYKEISRYFGGDLIAIISMHDRELADSLWLSACAKSTRSPQELAYDVELIALPEYVFNNPSPDDDRIDRIALIDFYLSNASGL